jgi:hypothetical protein
MMLLYPEQRQVLELLAKYQHGATEELFVLVHNIDRGTIADLVLEGLISRRPGKVKVDGKTVALARIRITEAGREALEES